jgi:iron(III) transport system substrate-binding protein
MGAAFREDIMIGSARWTVAAALGAVAAFILPVGQADADGACANPSQMDGFKTCADLAKAEQEGVFVLYTTDPEAGTAKLMASFNQAFPKIKTSFIRLQAGALFAKLMAERQAKSYLVDAMQISDLGFVLELEKRKGYMQYVSPEMAAYKADYKSKPEGYWTWGTVIMAGLAYNPKTVPARRPRAGPMRSTRNGAARSASRCRIRGFSTSPGTS